MIQTIEWTCDYCSEKFFRPHYQFIGEITNVFCNQKCFKLSRIKKAIKNICDNCGKEFERRPSQFKQNKNIFCSRECNKNFRTKKVKSSCANCGKDICRRPCELKENMFCSKPCADLFKRNKIKCTCANCGKESWRKPSAIKMNLKNDWRYFCNRTCRKKFSSEHPNTNGKGEWIPCDNCGKPKYYKSYTLENRILNGFFCSISCANFLNSKKYHPEWDKQRLSNYRGPNWKEQRQKTLFRDGYMCCLCGFTDGKLHVHHIRPFHSFGYIPNENDNYLLANQLDNLITLCPSHHQKVEKGSIPEWALQLAQFPPIA